jgi:hypothetical protein
LIGISPTEKSSTAPIVEYHGTWSPFFVNKNDQLESESDESGQRAPVSAADVRERVKELQDKTGDLSETLDRIEKGLEQVVDRSSS